MIKSVGIDLAGTGEHKVRCLDEGAQLYAGFCYQSGISHTKSLIFGYLAAHHMAGAGK